MQNATHLFEKPERHRHNSESWWSAFFSMLLLYEAKTNPSFCLPNYTYSTRFGYREVGKLGAANLCFSSVQVETPISASAFDLPGCPPELRGLKPDLSVHWPEPRRVTFIETKTIGATIAQKLNLYNSVCARLQQANWNADLCYLLSHGHEVKGDWPLIERHELRIILWEEALRAVIGTPLALVFDFDLTPYASRPDEPVTNRTI